MDFEDRLKNHLHTQGSEVHVEPATVSDVVDRSNSRRQRRMASSAMAVAVVLLGIGGFIVGGNGDHSPARIGDDLAAENQDGAPQDGDSSSTQEPQTVLTGPLVFHDVSDGNSPGGFNAFTNVVGPDGVYYVLSTAPGAPESGEYDWRADTLYRFDQGWSVTNFGDRFVSDFGQSGDLLYAMSAGSATADQPAMGTSADGGETWTWAPIEVDASLGTELQFSTASSGDRLLIIASANGFPDYDEGIDLAIEAGAPIDPDVHEVINVDHDGIAWIDRQEQSVCQAELDRIFDEAADDGGELVPYPFDDAEDFEELTQDQIAEQEEWNVANAKVYLELISKVGEFAGCERFSECLVETRTQQDEIFAEDNFPTDGDEEAMREFDEEQERLNDIFQEWLEESGCGEQLAYGDEDFEEHYNNASSATWRELGVTTPTSWTSQHEAAMFSNGEVVSLGPVFAGEHGFLIQVSASDNGGFEAQFEAPYEDEYGSYAEEAPPLNNGPEGVRYESPDGVNWENIGIGPLTWHQPSVFNGGSFSIRLEETENTGYGSADLLRNGEAITLEALLGDSGIDGSDLHLSQVVAGEYGVVVWATRRAEPGGDFDEDFVPDVETVVFFSQDGINWAPTELAGLEVFNVAVSANAVMVFAADPLNANNPDKPHPVLLGRAS